MTNNDNIVGEAPLSYLKKDNNFNQEITQETSTFQRICEMTPTQLWVNGAKGTGKSHFLMQYALWILSEEFTISEIQNIDTSLLKNKIQYYKNLQKIEVFSHYYNYSPDYLPNIFLEKTLKPLLQNAYQSYNEFVSPKKITTKQHFLIEFQDFLSKNMRVDTEMVEIFLKSPTAKPPSPQRVSKSKKSTQKALDNNQKTEKICLLGIEQDQLLYELHPQNTHTTGMVHYVEMQVLEELYYSYFYDKNFSIKENEKNNTKKNDKHEYYYKILEAFHSQKKENNGREDTQKKIPSYILVLDNVELALKYDFWQNILWAFSAKKRYHHNQEQFFVMPTGEKMVIPPNFYILCASSAWDKNHIQKAFLYDFAVLTLDLQLEKIQNEKIKTFAEIFNQFILKEKSAEYCLGAYFFQDFLENFELKNIRNAQTAQIVQTAQNDNFWEEYLLNDIFDFYIFPYLKTLFGDISLEKLSQKLQQAGIKNKVEQQKIVI